MKHAMFVMAMLLAGAVSGQEPTPAPSTPFTVTVPMKPNCVLWQDASYAVHFTSDCKFESDGTEQRIAALEKRVAELERLRGMAIIKSKTWYCLSMSADGVDATEGKCPPFPPSENAPIQYSGPPMPRTPAPERKP